jgi:hypothetical protein
MNSCFWIQKQILKIGSPPSSYDLFVVKICWKRYYPGSPVSSFFLNRPLLPCGVEGSLLCESIRQLVGLLGRVIGLTQGLYLHTGQHNTEKRRHTSMPRTGFETAISILERPKTVFASDRSAIEIGSLLFLLY